MVAKLQIWQITAQARAELRSGQKLSVSDEISGRFPWSAYHMAFEGEIPEVEVVEDAYFHFNRGTGGYLDQAEKQGARIAMYSRSVGDVVMLDGKAFRCASAGWEDVTHLLVGSA